MGCNQLTLYAWMFAKDHQEQQSRRVLGARSGQEAVGCRKGPPGGARESCGRCVGTGWCVPTCPHAGHSGELSQALAFGLQQSTGARCDKMPQRGVAKLSFTKSLDLVLCCGKICPGGLQKGCFHATLRGTGSLHCNSSGLARSSSKEPDSCSAPSGSTSSRRGTRWGRSPAERQALQADPTGGARRPLLTSASIQSPCASRQHFPSARVQLYAQHQLFL